MTYKQLFIGLGILAGVCFAIKAGRDALRAKTSLHRRRDVVCMVAWLYMTTQGILVWINVIPESWIIYISIPLLLLAGWYASLYKEVERRDRDLAKRPFIDKKP